MREERKLKKLGEVCEIFNGNSINADFKKKHFFGATGGLPFIATKDVSTIGSIDYDNGVRIPNYDEYKVAPANSVFVCAEGGSAGKKCAFVEQDVCFGNKLFCLNPKNDSIAGKYIYYFVQSNSFKDQFYALLSGLIGGVSAKKFLQIEIPVSSIDDQRCIVSRLDETFTRIDTLKNNAEKRLAEARDLYNKALTEKMMPKEGWDENLLGNIGTFKNGMNFSHNEKGYDLNIVGVGDFGNRFSIDNVEELTTVSLNQMPSEDYLLKDGDIVFVRSNGNKQLVGRSLVVYPKGHPVTFSGFCIRFRKSTTINERYLTYYLKCEGVRKKLFGNGANISNLNQKILQNLTIPIPSEDQQSVIVSYLDILSDNVRKLELNLQRTIMECDALKQAMLREVFE